MKWKNVHSPTGERYLAPGSYANLKDCPVCKYGTVTKEKDKYRCIDCQRVFTVEQIEKPKKK